MLFRSRRLHHYLVGEEHHTHRVLDLGSHHSISCIRVVCNDESLPPAGERHGNQKSQRLILFARWMRRPGSSSLFPFFGLINSGLDPRLCRYWNQPLLCHGSDGLQHQCPQSPLRRLGCLLCPPPQILPKVPLGYHCLVEQTSDQDRRRGGMGRVK